MPPSPVQSSFPPVDSDRDRGRFGHRARGRRRARRGRLDVGVTWHEDEAGAEATAAEVRSAGRRESSPGSTRPTSPAAATSSISSPSELGGVDVFVNNAGTGDNAPLLELTLDQWRHTVATDLDGAFVCIQHAARRMVAAGRGGRIIAITSVHEHQPRVGSSAYDAAKHGLGGLIKTAALELGAHGITVNAVAPGEIATPMTDQTDEDPSTHRAARDPAGPTRRRPRDRRRRRLPGLPGRQLRHRRVVGGRRRDAADGPQAGSHLDLRMARRLTLMVPPADETARRGAPGGQTRSALSSETLIVRPRCSSRSATRSSRETPCTIRSSDGGCVLGDR